MTTTSTPGRNSLLAALSILVSLISLEVAARIWVVWRWNAGARDALIAPVKSSRHGFIYDAETGYRLQPDVRWRDSRGREFTHNHLGLRARRELASPKPVDAIRIVLMGGSTVYGIYVDDAETSAVRLEEWLARRHPATQIEVVNAGVPGWTTRETIINLDRVLTLTPDIIVVADGRNDIFPELFDNYRDDYSHYRPIGFDFRNGNRVHKSVFRVSYLAMLLATSRGHRLGYSARNEHPAYGYVRWENRPTPPDIIRNGQDTSRTDGFRSNLVTLATRASAHGVQIVFASLPFLSEQFRSGVILPDPGVLSVLERFAHANNRLTERVARERELSFVDGATLTRPDLLFDDCHFTPAGEKSFAHLLGLAIDPLVPWRR